MDTVGEAPERRCFCAFCRRNYLESEARVAQGPGGSICEPCLRLCEEVLGQRKGAPVAERRTFCAFCGRRYSEVDGRMAEGPGVSICEDCVVELRQQWGSVTASA